MILVNSAYARICLTEIVRAFCRNLHTSRRCSCRVTHYDTLNVKRDCTSKEIREAFIKLSKQFHPDKNQNNPDNHSKFVMLNEAYSVLSKQGRRLDYDLSLVPTQPFVKGRNMNVSQPNDNRPFRDKTFWENRDRAQDKDYVNKPYYGIAGLKKLPNSWIVAFCFFFSVMGLGLQLLAISKSVTFKREQLDEASLRNGMVLAYVREQAKSNGNDAQIEVVRKRLASNGVTVADGRGD